MQKLVHDFGYPDVENILAWVYEMISWGNIPVLCHY